MTTIASTSATTSYRYTKLASATTESQSISSNVAAAGSSGGVSSTASDDSASIDSAQKLLSQLMSMLMSMQQGQTTSGGDQPGTDTAQDDRVTSMDTDGDGQVSMAEFVAARPSDVSEDQATSLFNSFDTEGSGSLTVDQLQEAMSANAPPMGAGPPPARSSSSSSSDGSSSDLFTSLDTDGDGVVSQEEFVAGRPSDVSEEQAANLFNSFDTEGSGSLTADRLQEAMSANAPPIGAGSPPPSSSDDSLSDLFSSLDTDGDGVISQAEFAAGRPDDVSEEQATALFESMDTDGAGSITKDQFVDAMKPQLPPSADFQYPDFASEEAEAQAFMV
ncbi:EF-hand domain-containing protein [Rhizobium sp. YTU87027]|uniref:EF-hand domain-containing protein n=1 Tax=Rhizobium sp. YTU87027 TaxID=3417741 RepID=UPI003D68E54E